MFNFAYNILSISNSNISMHHPDLDRVRPKTVKWTDILTILLHKKRHVKRGHTSTVNNTFFQNWLSSQLKNIRIWVLFVFPKSNFRDYLYRYNLYRIKTYGRVNSEKWAYSRNVPKTVFSRWFQMVSKDDSDRVSCAILNEHSLAQEPPRNWTKKRKNSKNRQNYP